MRKLSSIEDDDSIEFDCSFEVVHDSKHGFVSKFLPNQLQHRATSGMIDAVKISRVSQR